MGKKLAFLLLALTLLAGLAAGYVVGGLQAYARYMQNSLGSQQHCGGQAPVRICVSAPPTLFSAFYPSYVTTQTPLARIDYTSSTPLTLAVSVDIAGFTQVQTRTVNATSSTQSIAVTPPMLISALRKLTVDYNTSLHVGVTDMQGRSYYVNDSALLLHSRWLMQWTAANRLKVAAWVTPADPAIAALIARARNYLQLQPPPAPNAMVGYSKASPQQVADQVDAIFDTLRIDYKIHYVQANVPYNGPEDTSAATQNIKLPAEVLQQRSGMCIELTALLAAAVESIGLHSEIVLIPGHAFLGVALTPDSQRFEYWDGVEVNNNVAGASANISTDAIYRQNVKQGTIVDRVVISDARAAGIAAML